jgi:NADH dehydrogenase
MATTHLADIRQLFEQYDSNHDNNLTLNELNSLLTDVANRITALPAVRHIRLFPDPQLSPN